MKIVFSLFLIFSNQAHAQIGDFLRGLADKADKYTKQDSTTIREAILPNKNISSAKKYLEEVLYDPESVRYKNLRETNFGAVCGEYNAKNRYGGYIGFKPFIFFSKDITIFLDDEPAGESFTYWIVGATMNTSGLNFKMVSRPKPKDSFPHSYTIFKNQIYTTDNMKYDYLPSEHDNYIYKNACIWKK